MNKIHRYEYLLSTLPALDSIGSIPPVSKTALLELVTDSNGPLRTVEMILLYDDLTQYQGLLVGEIQQSEVDFAVLSVDKTEAAPVLPDFLLPGDASEEHESQRQSVDALWSRFFRYAWQVAKNQGSGFLKVWISFEVGLRNALAAARAQVLELDVTAYLVEPELADNNTDFSMIISAWSSAPNPMAAFEALDKARWSWLDEHSAWYSFTADEIEVYAAKLILLHNWRRILSETNNNSNNNQKSMAQA